MPNIATQEADAPAWPRDMDDLRAEPGRIVFAADLARLRIVRSYGGLKALPPPLKLPGGRLAWEARTVLRAIGADTLTPAA
jgi:hypothetical protein